MHGTWAFYSFRPHKHGCCGWDSTHTLGLSMQKPLHGFTILYLRVPDLLNISCLLWHLSLLSLLAGAVRNAVVGGSRLIFYYVVYF